MASFKIYWKAATKEVKIFRATDTAPVGYTLIKTVEHGGSEFAGSHVIYHHVQDALYALEPSEQDMSSISIVAFDSVANVTAIVVTPATVTLDISATETQQLTTVFTPAAPDNTSLTYESDDEAVATVSGTGLITPIIPGTATITVTSVDGGFTDTCVVTTVA